jgi:hypothetical protein
VSANQLFTVTNLGMNEQRLSVCAYWVSNDGYVSAIGQAAFGLENHDCRAKLRSIVTQDLSVGFVSRDPKPVSYIAPIGHFSPVSRQPMGQALSHRRCSSYAAHAQISCARSARSP